MKVLVHDYAGHGFIAELSRELVSRGNQVVHVYGNHTPSPKGYIEKTSDDSEALSFQPIELSVPFKKYSLLKRWQQERKYGKILAETVLKHRPDIVISAQTPLDAEAFLDKICSTEKIPLIHWLQDVIGVASFKILRKRIPILGSLIGLYYQSVEKRLLHNSSAVISISEDFFPILNIWNVSPEKIHLLPNWPPLSYLPVLRKDNEWARKHSLVNSFVFLYTGTLGFKHNPQLLYFLAKAFEHEPNVKVIVASEGPGANFLKRKVIDEDMQNLMIYPYQPAEKYAEVLATGDVLVGILEQDAGEFSVPSKILSYLCANRPILLSIPEENIAAKLVSENNAGLIVRPDSLDEFIKGGKSLFRDNELRTSLAQNGRQFADENFDITIIGEKFDSIIRELVGD